MRRPRGRPVAIATMLVALGLAVAGGCGIDTDSEPRSIARDNVPDGLLEAPPEPGSTLPAAEVEEVTVFFLRDDEGESRLWPHTRTVPRPASEKSVLEALLLSPPDEDERAGGLTTAIPSTTSLETDPERQDGGVLVVNVSNGFFQVQNDSLRLAYGQVVCTAAGIDGVQSVLFEVDGDPVPAFDGDGEEINAPVRCDAYDNLRVAG